MTNKHRIALLSKGRDRDVFGSKKIIIVTQKYHLYSALYDAISLGLNAYDVAAYDGSTAISGKCRAAAKAFSMEWCSLSPPI